MLARISPRRTPDETLLTAIGRAHVWVEDLKAGRVRDLNEIARRHGLPSSCARSFAIGVFGAEHRLGRSRAATRRSEPQAAHVPDGVGARLDTTTFSTRVRSLIVPTEARQPRWALRPPFLQTASLISADGDGAVEAQNYLLRVGQPAPQRRGGVGISLRYIVSFLALERQRVETVVETRLGGWGTRISNLDRQSQSLQSYH